MQPIQYDEIQAKAGSNLEVPKFLKVEAGIYPFKILEAYVQVGKEDVNPTSKASTLRLKGEIDWSDEDGNEKTIPIQFGSVTLLDDNGKQTKAFNKLLNLMGILNLKQLNFTKGKVEKWSDKDKTFVETEVDTVCVDLVDKKVLTSFICRVQTNKVTKKTVFAPSGRPYTNLMIHNFFLEDGRTLAERAEGVAQPLFIEEVRKDLDEINADIDKMDISKKPLDETEVPPEVLGL